MIARHLDVLVEEPSMEVALRVLLPKIIGQISFEIYAAQCKEELLARLPVRLRGYAARRKRDRWFRDHCRVAIVVDRDDEDCEALNRGSKKWPQRRDCPPAIRRRSGPTPS